MEANVCLSVLLALGLMQLCWGGGMTDGSPRTLNSNPFSSNRILAGAGLVGLGVLGKRSYDGPVFEEKVDLTGKVIVITGANTGLGKESALKLASLGTPEIVLLCRSEIKAKIAVDDIIAKTGNKNTRFIKLDLESLESIKNAARELTKSTPRIDVLQLNSGVMAIPEREVTRDGFEKHLGINHLGHFALAAELWPLLGKNSRVVTVSSSAHLLGNIDKDNLQLETGYGPWLAYGNSKLCNILFARELNRRLVEQGNPKGLISTCLHPGACRTELGRYIFDPATAPKALYPILGVAAAPAFLLTKSSKMGSQTQTFLSASSTLSTQDGGRFFDNSRPADTSAYAKDPDLAKWLWQESERLIGRKFSI